jgi:hypothetical protein
MVIAVIDKTSHYSAILLTFQVVNLCIVRRLTYNTLYMQMLRPYQSIKNIATVLHSAKGKRSKGTKGLKKALRNEIQQY